MYLNINLPTTTKLNNSEVSLCFHKPIVSRQTWLRSELVISKFTLICVYTSISIEIHNICTVHTSYNLNVTRVVHACDTQEPHVLYTSIFTSTHAITHNRIYLRVQAHTRNHHLLTRKAHFSMHTRIQVSRRVA